MDDFTISISIPTHKSSRETCNQSKESKDYNTDDDDYDDTDDDIFPEIIFIVSLSFHFSSFCCCSDVWSLSWRAKMRNKL